MGFFDLILVQPIFNLLLFIYSIVGDFGISIIIFTVIVKFLLWPLVKKQLHQTKLMRKIQPELAEIKKNAKGNKQVESLQMMDLYKKHNIKPFRSMLVMLIQLPIMIVLYRVVNMIMNGGDAVNNYAYGFMKDFSPVQSLINSPETFKPTLFGFIDLTDRAFPITGWGSILVLLLVVGSVVMQFVISRQQMPQQQGRRKFKDIMKEAAEGKEADQTEINNIVSGQMSKMLPLMTFFILVGLPGALALYYLVVNTITYVQQRYIFSRDEEELEELANKKIKSDRRRLKRIKEAEIVKTKKETIIKITAKDKKRRKKK